MEPLLLSLICVHFIAIRFYPCESLECIPGQNNSHATNAEFCTGENPWQLADYGGRGV